jgi:hypothetical protein
VDFQNPKDPKAPNDLKSQKTLTALKKMRVEISIPVFAKLIQRVANFQVQQQDWFLNRQLPKSQVIPKRRERRRVPLGVSDFNLLLLMTEDKDSQKNQSPNKNHF